ncbi:MAG: stage V sporulation T C-terminal domain-containing protein [Bacilli bacterium]
METTGVIRRVDSLGRIVIPKEIRKSLRIKPGECLEIFLDNEKIALRKKDLISGYSDSLEQFIDIVSKATNTTILITDTDKVLFASGNLSEKYLHEAIDDSIYNLMIKRKRQKNSFISGNDTENIIQPIIINGDAIGSVIFIREHNEIGEVEEKLIDIIANLLIRHIEI